MDLATWKAAKPEELVLTDDTITAAFEASQPKETVTVQDEGTPFETTTVSSEEGSIDAALRILKEEMMPSSNKTLASEGIVLLQKSGIVPEWYEAQVAFALSSHRNCTSFKSEFGLDLYDLDVSSLFENNSFIASSTVIDISVSSEYAAFVASMVQFLTTKFRNTSTGRVEFLAEQIKTMTHKGKWANALVLASLIGSTKKAEIENWLWSTQTDGHLNYAYYRCAQYETEFFSPLRSAMENGVFTPAGLAPATVLSDSAIVTNLSAVSEASFGLVKDTVDWLILLE